MTVKTLGQTTWNKIKVGEVFAGAYENLYMDIWIKTSRSSFIILEDADRTIPSFSEVGKTFMLPELHKLPVAFQRCFIEWK